MSRRPRIAYVCADRGVPVGGHKGASLHVAEMVRALGATADVEIFAARVASADVTTLHGAPVVDVGGSRAARRAREALLRSSEGGDGEAAAAEAAAVMRNQDLARALERAHRAAPFDAVYERYSLWSFAAATFARAQGIPFLLEANAPLVDEQKRYRELANEPLARTLERFLLGSADRVLVPSAALLPWATSCGAAARAVEVVPNAADPARFRPATRRTRRAPGDEFVVGFVGSLKPWHGLEDLVEVFRRLRRRHKGYRLLVVGEGPMRGDMEARLRELGLDGAATFTGATDHEQVPAWIARMDAAVAPYPKDAPTYFSPIKIFEYMAAGTPVVASSVGQIAEFLEHGRTALLHRPGAVAEAAARIEELRRSPALAAKLSREARATLVRRYTWKRNATRVLSLVRTVAREHASAARIAATGKATGKTTVKAPRA